MSSPIMGAFTERGGYDLIVPMIDFSIRGFHVMWGLISNFVSKYCSVGHGSLSKLKAMDVLCITLDILK